MRRRERLAEATTPDGVPLTLDAEGADFVVRVGRDTLMSSRQRGSEEVMAKLALPDDATDARVLVGGLGMGFTLRAVLDRAGPGARIDVAELLPEVVEWNRGVLGALADHPLEDSRVSILLDDVAACLSERGSAASAERYTAIALDVDNGPEAFTVKGNDALYDRSGLALLYSALAPGGILVLWSAFRSQRFERELKEAGFVARSVTVRARAEVARGGSGGKGARHTLFEAQRPV